MPVSESSVPLLLKQQWRLAIEEMLKDAAAVEKAVIAVERINGPIFLLSATGDEYWPSTQMPESMVRRLQAKRFPHRYRHVAIEGNHTASYEHLNQVEAFLNTDFLVENAAGCPRAIGVPQAGARSLK